MDLQTRPRFVSADVVNQLVAERLDAGSVSFVITTGSMLPTLAPGDRVIVRGIAARDVRLGDIVVAQVGDVRRVHRAIARRVENGTVSLVTRGDNSARADDPWCETQLLGLAIAVQRNARTINLQSLRPANRVIAFLSQCEWQAQQLPHRLVCRALRRVLRLSLRVAACGIRIVS